MPRFAEYGDVTRAGACKFCGRKLRRPSRTVWAHHHPKSCKGCGSTNLALRPIDPSWTGSSQHSYRCNDCEVYTDGPRTVVSRAPTYAKPGDYGDGHFCGVTCGYGFAVAIADLGRILVPVAAPEAAAS